MTITKIIIIALHSFTGWILCGATFRFSNHFLSIETTLVIHTYTVPVIFMILSNIYFRKFNYTTPIITATIFLTFTIVMDFFVVALFLNENFDMFKSIIGTWIPFALIFMSTYIAGSFCNKNDIPVVIKRKNLLLR